MINAGIDVGSVFTKVVLINDHKILSFAILPSAGGYVQASEKTLKEALTKAKFSTKDLEYIVATGIGASRLSFATHQLSDVSCQSKGTNYLFPSVRTVIDLGGQSARVIKINPEGRVVDFIVGEKCAAGSGRFLQLMARILRVGIEEMGLLSLKSKNPIEFSTSCAVFAESEAISRIAEGAHKEDIIAGVHQAMAARILSLTKRINLEMDCAFTGGGAKDVGLVRHLKKALGIEVLIPPEPLITTALGAACIATERSKGAIPESALTEREKFRATRKDFQADF